MCKKILIAGGGVGGLAAALACGRGGAELALFEQAAEFTEVGAGIQMGPNVVKLLHAWGLQTAVAQVAAYPERLQVRSAVSGAELGVLRLGTAMEQRYGAPYATIHRADLHGLLLAAVKQHGAAQLNLDSAVARFTQDADGVTLHTRDGRETNGDMLVGADGLWSQVRRQLLNDGAPRATGHLAYRALVPQSGLPAHLRSQQVTAWLGPQLHVVQYPVRGGESLNVVAIVHGRIDGDFENWDHSANAIDLRRHMSATCSPLQDLIQAIDYWRLWALRIRAPMGSASEQAQGRVALLGDAAHPMLPYLAQGAGMAIEDAAELGRALDSWSPTQPSTPSRDLPGLLSQFAVRRWQRNARVQARAIRNGQIFHATGPVRLGRNLAMKLLGERLLDAPWLYGGS